MKEGNGNLATHFVSGVWTELQKLVTLQMFDTLAAAKLAVGSNGKSEPDSLMHRGRKPLVRIQGPIYMRLSRSASHAARERVTSRLCLQKDGRTHSPACPRSLNMRKQMVEDSFFSTYLER
jgi:hypothetical protein